MPINLPEVTYLVEPRFPGGTSSALSEEIRAISSFCRPTVLGVKSKMFSGDAISPKLKSTFQECHVPFAWCGTTVQADTIIIQNPSFLKFQDTLNVSLLAKTIIVVTHENFYRPTGEPAFDIDVVLNCIDKSSLSCQKFLAPISPYNRSTVERWVQSCDSFGWSILPQDWFNICEFDLRPPTNFPQDRRGRLSRAGNEKFPPLNALDQSFPDTSDSCLLLGADTLVPFASTRPHWEIHPFGSMPVDTFFDGIDFMVYHTSPTWRESFGRVIAEAIAAGKVVITDTETAINFYGGVVHSNPENVSMNIENIINCPGAYQAIVAEGQKALSRYSAQNFCDFFSDTMSTLTVRKL